MARKKEEEVIPIPALDDAAPASPLPEMIAEPVAVSEPASEAAPEGPAPLEPPKRRRHRRTKAEMNAEAMPPAPPPPVLSEADKAALAATLAVAFRTVGTVVALRRGPHWRLSEEEEQSLGTVWAEALAPYVGGSGKYAPLALACVVTVGVALPRLDADRIGHAEPAPAREVPASIPDLKPFPGA